MLDSFKISEEVKNMSEDELDKSIAILEAKAIEEGKNILCMQAFSISAYPCTLPIFFRLILPTKAWDQANLCLLPFPVPRRWNDEKRN